jgi:hypothetical protein
MRAMFTISLFFSCFCCNCTNSATSDSYVVFLNLLNSSSDKRLRKASRALVNASVGPGAVTETNVACWESAPVDDLLVFCVAGGVFMVGLLSVRHAKYTASAIVMISFAQVESTSTRSRSLKRRVRELVLSRGGQ